MISLLCADNNVARFFNDAKLTRVDNTLFRLGCHELDLRACSHPYLSTVPQAPHSATQRILQIFHVGC